MSDPRNLSIDYVEFGTVDLDRAKGFYEAAFGWRFTQYGPTYAGFKDGRGAHEAGGFDATVPPTPGGPLIVLYAEDLAAAERRVRDAGGAVVKPVFPFPGGRRFHFTDPDGHELAVWSDKETPRDP